MTEERIDGEETKENKKPKKSLKRELMEDVIMIVFVLVTVWVMKNYVLINAVIPSASMEDTIMTGDRTDRCRKVPVSRPWEESCFHKGESLLYRPVLL